MELQEQGNRRIERTRRSLDELELLPLGSVTSATVNVTLTAEHKVAFSLPGSSKSYPDGLAWTCPNSTTPLTVTFLLGSGIQRLETETIGLAFGAASAGQQVGTAQAVTVQTSYGFLVWPSDTNRPPLDPKIIVTPM